MENENVGISFQNISLTHDNVGNMSCRSQYSLPENYNPSDHPPVKLRNHSNADMSETQRKRRSKNRLSNRRSTGYVSADAIEEALKMGPDGTPGNSDQNCANI